MKTKEKILIAVAAVMITLIGFSLMASPAFDLLSFGSQNDTAITVTWQIDAEKTAAKWDRLV